MEREAKAQGHTTLLNRFYRFSLKKKNNMKLGSFLGHMIPQYTSMFMCFALNH